MAFYNERRRLAFQEGSMKATGNDKATRAAMLADQLADAGECQLEERTAHPVGMAFSHRAVSGR